VEGDVSDDTLHENLVSSLFRPASTNMANVAHFMCELITDATAWGEWRGCLPVIVNAGSKTALNSPWQKSIVAPSFDKLRAS
jgi:hypothetical protein